MRCAVAALARGRKTANSSPPKRPTRSRSERTAPSNRSAKARITASPAAWPWLSLTLLKWSRSTMIREVSSPLASQAAMASLAFSMKERRFSTAPSAGRSRPGASIPARAPRAGRSPATRPAGRAFAADLERQRRCPALQGLVGDHQFGNVGHRHHQPVAERCDGDLQPGDLPPWLKEVSIMSLRRSSMA